MYLRALLQLAFALIWLLPLGQGARADIFTPTREMYLDLARQGWVYEFGSSLKRRDPTLPPVHFDAKRTSTGSVCIIGAPAHKLSRAVLGQFESLLVDIFERKIPLHFADRQITDCPPAQRVYLRLYSGRVYDGVLNADLRALDQMFDLGLPTSRPERINSPAQGFSFFGRNGNVAHLMVRQPDSQDPSRLERDFYRSILIEELFHVFSFGLDIPKISRETPFLSKLQEHPVYLKGLDWTSPDFMRRLLASNPGGLCAFDVFMLHALAQMPLDSSNSEAFLVHIKDQFDLLLQRTRGTLADPAFDLLLERACLITPQPAQMTKVHKN
ncbi:MAG: hypothetical protein ABJI96_06040 [Paracoccaceae bacterium]